jgi:hypothetical protein
MKPSSEPLYAKQNNSQLEYFRVCNVCSRTLPITCFEEANHGTTRRLNCKDCVRTKNKDRAQQQIILSPITSKSAQDVE